jgi:hypothetical protein
MNSKALSITVLAAAVLGGTAACSSQTPAAGAAASSAPTAGAGAPSPGAASTATTSSTAVPDWTTLPTSWLSPAEVPFSSAFHWTGGSPSTAQTAPGTLDSTPITYPCVGYASPNDIVYLQTAKNYGTNSFEPGAGAPTSLSGQAGAYQSYALFASDAAAQAAFTSIGQDVAKCDEQIQSVTSKLPGTASTAKTVDTGDTLAYTYVLRDEKGNPAQVEGNYSSSADYHAYVVLKANLIDIVWLDGDSSIDGSGSDTAYLAAISGALSN